MEKFIEILKKLRKIFSNKYLGTFIALLIWTVFIDQYNLVDRCSNVNKLGDLRKEKEYHLEEIEMNTYKMNELQTNSKKLEKFAREEYLMKKNNEEIFVIVKEDD